MQRLYNDVAYKMPAFAGTRGIISCARFTVKVGKEGLEPSRLAAHDPKSCLSANSSISPTLKLYKIKDQRFNL